MQYLRALAASMVLVGHVLAEAEHYFGFDILLRGLPWTRGVDIFFVISGFIIVLVSRDLHGTPGGVRTFLRRRFWRVVPLYWLFTTLMLCILLVVPGAAKDTVLDWQQVEGSYLFFPLERYDGRIAPILSLGWTLNFEVFFYGLFALSLLVPRKLGLILLLCGLMAWVLIGALFGFTAPALRFWSNPIVLEFGFGVCLGWLHLRRGQAVAPSLPISLVLCVCGMGALCAFGDMDGIPRWLGAGLPATALVAGAALFWPQPSTAGPLSRLGELLGDSSYALYLSHRFVLRSLTLGLLPLLPATGMGALGFVVVACFASVGVGILVFATIERPFLIAQPRRVRPA